MNVLTVEDDKGMSLLLKMAFEESCPHIAFHLATDARQGLSLLRQTPSFPRPNVMIVDIQLPGMDGFELLEHLKNDAHLKEIPVIVLTTSVREQDRRKCLEMGALHYCKKGDSFDEIMSLVQEICKLAEARAA